jgi:hypothetical protein
MHDHIAMIAVMQPVCKPDQLEISRVMLEDR